MYAELHCHSNFSLLAGGSHPEALAERAAALGLDAIALTDDDGLYGAVRFHLAAKSAGVKAIIGASVTLTGGARVVLLVREKTGYHNLSALLTHTRMHSPRGEPACAPEILWTHAEGLVLLAGPESPAQRALFANDAAGAAAWMHAARAAFGPRHVFLEAHRHLGHDDDLRFARLLAFAETHGFLGVATNAARYAAAGDRPLYDVLTCVREHTTLDKAGRLLEANAERRLKSPEEMKRLFRDAPLWVRRTAEVAQMCSFDMEQLRYKLPAFDTGGDTPDGMLRRLVYEGAAERYGETPSEKVRAQLEHELGVIARLGFAGYFLIVWDIVRYCRERGTLCQGRGSAANSAVCFCLGITAVDPVGMELLFERFLSAGRAEPPDIDLDIAHNYREPILQYVYEKYGREYAGMVCEVITYRRRSAARDVGKALGLSLDQVDRIAKTMSSYSPFEKSSFDGRLVETSARPVTPDDEREKLREAWGVDPESPQVRALIALAERIAGFPRHLSIHVGGMVVSAEPLHRMVPVEPAAMADRTVIQWDKDDAAAAGLVKIDLLGLGMLTLLQDGFALIEKRHDKRMRLHDLDFRDPAVYDLLCKADTVGVFQVESRAQMNCLPRLKPRRFYDLVVEVALIRPGPIQGEMVHPYLRRRDGEEAVTYPHPDLIPILERTLGVPLFQEQGMRVAVVAAGFSAAEADELRRAMGSKRSRERMHMLLQKLIRGMERNGYGTDIAERIVKQLTAFADYGFPESHAAGFAILVYASAWMKKYHPAEFYTALLNAQPMGFYSPATIVNDAKRHAIDVRPPDVRESGYDAQVESDTAFRIGLRSVRGLGSATREDIEAALARRPYASLGDALDAFAVLPLNLRRSLIAAGAFDSFGPRRDVRWAFEERARGTAGPLDVRPYVQPAAFAPLSRVEEMQAEYKLTGLSVHDQPVSFYRRLLRSRGAVTAQDLLQIKNGARVRIGGLVICRQRPVTAKGMLFITLEDETGLANLVVFPHVLERARLLFIQTPLIIVQGKLERAHDVTNVIADTVEAMPPLPKSEQLSFPSRDFH